MTNSNSNTLSRKASSNKYPATARLKERYNFAKLQKSGEKLYSKHFLVSIMKSEGNSSRLGIAVTKKVSSRAVDRNKIKRRLREIFRLNRSQLRDNFDIVIVARRDAHLCTYQETRHEVLGALKRGGYIDA